MRARAGRFVAVVGPSGAGKDSLIDAARQAFADDARFHFAQRYITRPHDAGGEAHIEVSHSEFAGLAAEGAFALHWRAHGMRYGIAGAIALEIDAGACVIANLSRAAVADARARFAETRVVHVTAPPDVIAARLAARERETSDAVASRLARQAPLPGGDHVYDIVNAGRLEDAVREFTDLLQRLSADAPVTCG